MRPEVTIDGEAAIHTQGLTKVFDTLEAVARLDLLVPRGEIFGFLGPNGAGKTTTIKMLLGLTKPTSGQIWVDGLSLQEHGPEIRARIGYVPERVAFYPNLTAMQTLRFFADLRGTDRAECAPVLESVGLRAFADARVGTFSRGMVQLLGVGQALLGSPHLLVLDEPTAGLDPRWTRMVKDRMLSARKAGATVFFSSHLLGEVQELADRVAILHRGRLVAEDTVEALGRKVSPKPRLHLRVRGDPRRAAEAVQGMDRVDGVETGEDELVVQCDEDVQAKVIQRLLALGLEVLGMKTEEASLEEAFLRLTEEGKEAVR